MNPPLWAPWRMEYVLSPKNKGACIFCGLDGASPEEREERLVVAVTSRASVLLNRYPFASGHLLVVPHHHVDALEKLSDDEYAEMFFLVRESSRRLRDAVRCEGLNVGMNLGAVAGGSIKEHVHVHIVPRWSGDTNFMPVLGDTRVVPQALGDTRAHLERFFADVAASVTPLGARGT
jgi:ATP adenylyltransferase